MRLNVIATWLLAAFVSPGAFGLGSANAETLRWPAATYLPKPYPVPAPPPAVLERPGSVIAAKATKLAPTPACREGSVCVVCIAACDVATPAIVHSQKPRSTGALVTASAAENDSDGVAANAPRFARLEWAGIACGSDNGCRVSGISAPPRARSIDVHISVSRPTVGGANSWYIDGP